MYPTCKCTRCGCKPQTTETMNNQCSIVRSRDIKLYKQYAALKEILHVRLAKNKTAKAHVLNTPWCARRLMHGTVLCKAQHPGHSNVSDQLSKQLASPLPHALQNTIYPINIQISLNISATAPVLEIKQYIKPFTESQA